MIILGLNAYHGDSSACIVIDGRLIAAAEEERFRRIKHWAGFPKEAIRYCLKEANIGLEELDYIALNRNPKANFYKKIMEKIICPICSSPKIEIFSTKNNYNLYEYAAQFF